VEDMLDKLEWDGATNFANANYTVWYENKKPVGYNKTGGNLTFVIVNKASHMMPRD